MYVQNTNIQIEKLSIAKFETYITYGNIQSRILFVGYHFSSPKQVFYAMTFRGITVTMI